MKTTIYKNDSLVDTVMDTDKTQEWNRLNQILGIENAEQPQSPIPFLLLNTRMQTMFKVLCPQVMVLSQYTREPIPLEVLQVAAFCKTENFFTYIQVWYDDKSPDPILVGIKRDMYVKSFFYGVDKVPPSKWHGKLLASVPSDIEILPQWTEERENGVYLIARWGDEDKPFSVLRDLAVKRYSYQTKLECQQRIREYQRQIDDIDSKVADIFPII
jgi:hypothetical protein